MAFSMYALLGRGSPRVSTASLARDLQRHFRKQDDLDLRFVVLPFTRKKVADLHWHGGWGIQVGIEKGIEVRRESAEISKLVGAAAPKGLERIEKRIHVVFDADPKRKHTDQVVETIEYLRRLPGAHLFDVQERKLFAVLP